MKILLSFSLLCWFSGFSQNKIEGLGIFKINKTTSSAIDSIAKSISSEIPIAITESALIDYQVSDKPIIELYIDSSSLENAPDNSHICNYTITYFINKFTIADINITDLYLTFYNDTLIQIKINCTPELINAIELKYGKGILKKSPLHEITCVYHLTGHKEKFQEFYFEQYWINNKIRCNHTFGLYRTDNCKEASYSNLEISDTNKMSFINKCDLLEEKRIKILNENDKKKKLKDF